MKCKTILWFQNTILLYRREYSRSNYVLQNFHVILVKIISIAYFLLGCFMYDYLLILEEWNHVFEWAKFWKLIWHYFLRNCLRWLFSFEMICPHFFMIVNSISIPKSKIKPKEILIKFQITDFIIKKFSYSHIIFLWARLIIK